MDFNVEVFELYLRRVQEVAQDEEVSVEMLLSERFDETAAQACAAPTHPEFSAMCALLQQLEDEQQGAA